MAGFKPQTTEQPSSSPPRQNLIDPIADSLTGCSAIHSLCQEFVVFGMLMSNRCDHCRSQSAHLQVPARLCPPNAPAASGGSIFGNCSAFMSRTAGEQDPDLLCHASNQLAVFFAASHGFTGASCRSFIRIFRAFPLGFFESRCFNQDALSLVTFSGPAKADHHSASRAMFRCPPGQSHVPRSKKLEVAETGAWQAERLLGFHKQERSLPHLQAALRALPIAHGLEHDWLWSAIQFFLEFLLLALRKRWR